jgi:hypothetical protein
MNPMTDWQPDVMFADPGTPAGLRTMLQARYQHLVLKFLTPPVTGSCMYEATWAGGKAEAGTEEELLRIVCEELQDCGTARHDWVTVSETRDPSNEDNTLRTQRLECAHCDPRERVITVSSPRGLPAPARAGLPPTCPRGARPAGGHPPAGTPSDEGRVYPGAPVGTLAQQRPTRRPQGGGSALHDAPTRDSRARRSCHNPTRTGQVVLSHAHDAAIPCG